MLEAGAFVGKTGNMPAMAVINRETQMTEIAQRSRGGNQ